MTNLEHAIRLIKNQEKLLVRYRIHDTRPIGNWIDQIRIDRDILEEAGLL